MLLCDTRERLSIVDVDGTITEASGSSFSTKCETDDDVLSESGKKISCYFCPWQILHRSSYKNYNEAGNKTSVKLFMPILENSFDAFFVSQIHSQHNVIKTTRKVHSALDINVQGKYQLELII